MLQFYINTFTLRIVLAIILIYGKQACNTFPYLQLHFPACKKKDCYTLYVFSAHLYIILYGFVQRKLSQSRWCNSWEDYDVFLLKAVLDSAVNITNLNQTQALT